MAIAAPQSPANGGYSSPIYDPAVEWANNGAPADPGNFPLYNEEDSSDTPPPVYLPALPVDGLVLGMQPMAPNLVQFEQYSDWPEGTQDNPIFL